MQKAYISALCEIAGQDKNVLSLLADSGTGYDELFRKYFPEQILDFGIAEENTISVAAGLAMCGKIPFVYTIGSFLAYRAYEFIRDDVCFQNLNIKITGMGAGVSLSTMGPTHHTTEDLAALRALPNLTVFSPSCPREVEKVVQAAYRIHGPVYIRIGMNNEPDIYQKDYEFVPGKNYVIREGRDLCIFSTGSIISEALDAAERLAEKGIEAAVINVPTLSPFDGEQTAAAASRYPAVFTVEEHSIVGGLGSAVAEALAEHGVNVKFRRIGLMNCFAKSYGTHGQVKAANGLDGEGIFRRIYRSIQ